MSKSEQDAAYQEMLARRLIDCWRDRAESLRPYCAPAALSYEKAADELEQEFGDPKKHQAFRRMLCIFRAELASDLRRVLEGQPDLPSR